VIEIVKQFARYAEKQKCVLQFCGERFQVGGLWFNGKIFADHWPRLCFELFPSKLWPESAFDSVFRQFSAETQLIKPWEGSN
jgi:hypothetical protein